MIKTSVIVRLTANRNDYLKFPLFGELDKNKTWNIVTTVLVDNWCSTDSKVEFGL